MNETISATSATDEPQIEHEVRGYIYGPGSGSTGPFNPFGPLPPHFPVPPFPPHPLTIA